MILGGGGDVGILIYPKESYLYKEKQNAIVFEWHPNIQFSAEPDQWPEIGLTASLVSQFFSREFCGKWDLLLAKISVRVSRVSRVSQEGKTAIYCQACESRNFVSLAVARLTNKQSHNSQWEISVRLKILARFSQDSRVEISNDSRESRYEISVCDTRESCSEICLWDSREMSLATKLLSARLVRIDSRYEIS